MRFSVCIPTVRPTTLGDAVRSIRDQTHTDWELIVVGQGDRAQLEAATDRAARGDSRVRYVHLDRRGASVARNAGAAHAQGEIVAFMDDDCEADSRWLAVLDECFQPEIGLVAGSLLAPPKERRWFASCPTVEPADVVYDPELMDARPPGFDLLGANIAVRGAEIARVGGFDESMGPGSVFQGGEEHDYVHRLSQLDVKMRSTPASIVRHTHGRRHGLRAVYRLKRERIRGDSAVAAKGTLALRPTGGDRVRDRVLELARAQLKIIVARRRPWSVVRVGYFLAGYRECLRGFVLTSPDLDDLVPAVLIRRPGGPVPTTGAVVRSG